MKKIMFSDKYGLTEAVMEGRKTMTRRIVAEKMLEAYYDYDDWVCAVAPSDIPCSREYEQEFFLRRSPFKPGEVVAVAQSYNDSGWNPNTLQQTFVKEPTVFPDLDPISPLYGWIDLPLKYHKGWSNKMFVYAGLMPHQIRITNVRAERLQDISDEDCFREGIYWDYGDYPYMATKMYKFNEKEEYLHPKGAFAALVDKVSGKGTWASNPWVFVYEFELVK